MTVVTTTVPLLLVIDEDRAREGYLEYVAEVEWLEEHGGLTEPHGNFYGSDAPISFTRYLADWIDSCLADALEQRGVGYRLALPDDFSA